jgi:hypothetical protein
MGSQLRLAGGIFVVRLSLFANVACNESGWSAGLIQPQGFIFFSVPVSALEQCYVIVECCYRSGDGGRQHGKAFANECGGFIRSARRTAEELNSQTVELQDVIGFFKVDDRMQAAG